MSNDPTVPPTPPTIETVLERMNALGERLSAEIARVHADLTAEIAKVRDDLSAEIQVFREEVNEKLSKLDCKIDVLNDEFLEIKAEQKWHGKRLDELERKVS